MLKTERERERESELESVKCFDAVRNNFPYHFHYKLNLQS